MSLKILFSAGELSGDEHLSELLESCKRLQPDSEFRGMAGSKTRNAGFETALRLEDYASVMGFTDVIKKIPTVFKALGWFKKQITEWKPDILILVDYPDFNLKLAKIARNHGVKTFYFIPPKLWAWRQSRIKKIKDNIDCMAAIFPFEKSFYKDLGYDNCYYVGHPFADTLLKDPETEAEKRLDFFKLNNLNPEAPTLALFPGSRYGELQKHLLPALQVIKALSGQINNLQVLVSGADSVRDHLQQIEGNLNMQNIKFLYGKNLEILRFSDAGLIKSGTSNLQAAFYLLPFLMFYKTNWISEQIVRFFVKIKQYSLVNIISKDSIKEHVGKELNTDMIVRNLKLLLTDSKHREEAIKKLEVVRSKLGSHEQIPEFDGTKSAYERAAKLALKIGVAPFSGTARH